jgi:hypothetical protein
VREGEAATVRNAQGVPDQIRTLYAKLQSGDQLSVAQRQEILKTSEKIYEGAKSVHDTTVRPMFDKYADELKVRREIVTGNPDFESSIEKFRASSKPSTPAGGYPPKAGAPATIKSKAEFDALPSGTEYINSKGQRARKP